MTLPTMFFIVAGCFLTTCAGACRTSSPTSTFAVESSHQLARRYWKPRLHRTIFQLESHNDNQGETIKPKRHSALAQVLANQYGLDLKSVVPSSREPGAKITAADVEYHAWKMSQPPCMPEVLKVAYSLGLNLNELYDDDDREYVMTMADVELYVENSRSLKMTSQIKKNASTSSLKKIERKMNALDKRVEQNVEKLTYKAMQAAMNLTDGIVKQIKSEIGKSVQNPLVKLGKDQGTNVIENASIFETVADFDIELANEIQEALSVAEELSVVGVQLDDRQNIDDSDSVGERYSVKQLQSMTCIQLKEELRHRGLKISGKKAELVDRLLYWADPVPD